MVVPLLDTTIRQTSSFLTAFMILAWYVALMLQPAK